MAKESAHGKLVADLHKQLNRVFSGSSQGVYLYLDDHHKVCNKKFASMLGYTAKEWASIHAILGQTVEAKSQKTLVSAYLRAVDKLAGSTISVTWVKKKGGKVKTDVILVPIVFKGNVFALHFVSGI
ncbi:MAG TPA: hypothetical protein VJI46_00720 [Candidatus Nanoarchaeia archaeon]|nr:hypothetical protein [Candidatus Nanoarchaeia archaeon]